MWRELSLQVFWCLINFALLFYNFQYCMYYSLLKIDKESFIKKHDNQKNPKIQTNTQNPLKTSLFNQIWSYRVVIDQTSMVDHVWPNIDQTLQTLTTHFSQSNRLIAVILRQHQYLTTFFQSNSWILDLSPEHYGHVLLYQNTKKFWLVMFS